LEAEMRTLVLFLAASLVTPPMAAEAEMLEVKRKSGIASTKRLADPWLKKTRLTGSIKSAEDLEARIQKHVGKSAEALGDLLNNCRRSGVC